MRKKRKRLLFDIIRILVLLIAFSVLLYPTISNYLYEKNSSRAVDNYDDTSEKLDEARRQAILQEAREYNARLVGGTGIAGDTFHTKEETTSEYDQLLRMDVSGMMGYIIIPKIEVELPIYHTTSEAVLQSGIGHFPSSSLPVGGESTHSVLTGHRGLPSKILFTDLDKLVEGDVFYIKILGETFAYHVGGESTHSVLTGHRGLPSKILFTDLDKLVEGDVFYIKILGETFAYQVDQILTVLPEDTKALSIEPGKDYVTLVTCTPYAVNTHRLLVRGVRIPYEEAVKQAADERITPDIEPGKDYVTLVTCTPYAVNTHRLLVRGVRIPYEEAVKQAADERITPELPFQVKMLILAVVILILIFIIYLIWKKVRKRKTGDHENEENKR